MSSQGSSESCRLQCQRYETTGHKKCRKLDTVRPGKKEAVQGNRKDLNFAAGSPRTRRNSQYRQCGFIGTLNLCEICDVVNE